MGEKNGTMFLIVIVLAVAVILMEIFPDFIRKGVETIEQTFLDMISSGTTPPTRP